MKKAGFDVAAIYRKHLSNAPSNLPALSGLVASGDASDLAAFLRYLESPFASRRAEAICGIGRVGSETDVLGLRRMLLDESTRVARAAHQHLQPFAKSLDAGSLFGLLDNCKTIAGKHAILRLLLARGHWAALSYLLRGAACPNEALKKCSMDLLNLTIAQIRFTQPSSEQRKRIQTAINESKTSFDTEYFKWLKPYLSGCGFETTD